MNIFTVAPHAGAWIETSEMETGVLGYTPSPLMQGRGLKLRRQRVAAGLYFVAPHAGAWIETGQFGDIGRSPVSPLMQGRGLKQIIVDVHAMPPCRPSCRGVD